MNILYLVHRIPYPPDKGDKIRSHRWLRHLAARHRVHLVTLYDDPGDVVHLKQLEGLCASVHALPLRRNRARIKALLGLLGSAPLSLAWFDSAELKAAVADLVAREGIDLALCYSSSMAPYLDGLDLPLKVMDMVDVDSEKFRSYAALGRGPKARIYGLEARRLARYEEKLVEDFDSVILCTEQEAVLLADRVERRDKIVAIGNGVDLPEIERTEGDRAGQRLIFVGAMDYQANVDAVVYAAHEIMPLVLDEHPDARFQIVGRDPTPEVRALAALPGVEVTGAVPDIGRHLADATLSLVPLRVAQGIQNKVLEAMAWALPVITAPRIVTSLGLDDLGPVIAAESAKDYARAVVDLLEDPDECRRRGRAGRAFVAEAFAWQPRLDALDRTLRIDVARTGAPA
ncbi:MAG: TIGR03087 family PEP-CTERM/XrtA system glycosyltransferase [Planctomycetes bacterium]|nr:TIGR03087 family PEP-CTERM/XrtA system glycosyltransferase [Planctomycetota bacterium]